MLKWSKIIDNETKEVQLGVGQDPEYYASIGMEELDVEQAWNYNWYLKGHCPIKPEPTHEEIIKQEIQELEEQITPRNLRCAIFGDEFAIDKIAQIEAQIDELRKQL